MWKVREQARLQLQSAQQGKTLYELLDPERDADGALVADRGLSAVPTPNEGDLFFDIEGDPFAFWEGLEYLFGVWETPQGDRSGTRTATGLLGYDGALDREAEKQRIRAGHGPVHEQRREQFPDMHIYHYGAYEPSHLKMLAGRHATREEELDQLLRARVFVDLYRVVRQGVRVGAESYSIKKLEPLYGYKRDDRAARRQLEHRRIRAAAGGGRLQPVRSSEKIRLYNRDDCISTEQLRDWLEERRVQAARRFGFELPRPPAQGRRAGRGIHRATTARARARGTPDCRRFRAAAADQTDTDKATWLVRHLLDWHRRENKSTWWRFYELMGMSEDELIDEAEPIGQLEFVERSCAKAKASGPTTTGTDSHPRNTGSTWATTFTTRRSRRARRRQARSRRSTMLPGPSTFAGPRAGTVAILRRSCRSTSSARRLSRKP